MKRGLILMLLALTTSSLFALTLEAHASKGSIPTEIAVQEPTFKGGDFEAYKCWLRDNIKYPASLKRHTPTIEAHIRLRVAGDGGVSAEYLNSPQEELIEEIERTIRKAPKLSLAAKGEAFVSAPFILGFDIREDYQSASSSISNAVMPTVSTPYEARILMRGYSWATTLPSLLSMYNNLSEYSTWSYAEKIQRIYHARLNMMGSGTKAVKVLYPSAYIQELGDSTLSTREYASYHIYADIEVTKQIALKDGRPYAEYIDWLVENIANIKGYDIEEYGVPMISMIHECNGKISSMDISFLRDKKFARKIKHIVKRSPKIDAAQLNGNPVRYKHTILTPPSRLKGWKTLSFADEVKQNIANDTPINLEFADRLPSYNGGTIADFEREFTAQVSRNAPSSKGSVSLSITIEKDGAIGEVEVLSGEDYKLKLAAVNTLVTMPRLWTPAEVYGQRVACTIYLTISA